MVFQVLFNYILKSKKLEIRLDVTATGIKKISTSSIDPVIKNYRWLHLVCGVFEMFDCGHQVAMLVNENKNMLEGSEF